ncbi:DUF3857 domain-containing protein [Erythrobacter sp. HKB08]|uniref:DUF3857 domain-containing protein n=1 Tax=Erythrobacter sp. HKB08 TaxID=2502843 RepID=UPI0013E8C5B5|nr:DUF3857 domain-containing protein [Erythrobacter sp. HKB08]
MRFEAAPDWVIAAEIDSATMQEGPSEVLFDWQHRLEDGVVATYNDRIVRIDNPETLTSEGTLQYTWAPDKGDLFIHRLEIIRRDEVIDLVAQGIQFDVIRREQNLERRLIDGRLTATVAVPGLREGDMLRVAHSTTLRDQALGEEMQAIQYLPPEPWRVGYGRVIASWPSDDAITWRADPFVDSGTVTSRDGYNFLEIPIPIAKREDMPADSPSRYQRPPILRVGSFGSWQELSRVMEPHFTDAAQIEPGGDVDRQVEMIMAQTDDPKERTALAVRLVQDQVSYLLDGLDGGNYLPQAAEDTWDKRYGDCKAKSVLLLAMLRRMGIDSDVVLVTTRGGDALPELLPMPANFDHMIVRATVDGTDYWLDGTSTATRLNNMSAVPAFHYALPLVDGGADLVAMSDRTQAHDDMAMHVTLDHSAGIDLPMMFDITVEFGGASSAQLEKIVDEDDPEVRKQIARNFGAGQLPGAQVTEIGIGYDDEKALGMVRVKGVADPQFAFDSGQISTDLAMVTNNVKFAPNRARPVWRDIPVATMGPRRNSYLLEMTLPQDGAGFELVGTPSLDDSFANTTVRRSSSLNGEKLRVFEQSIFRLGEVSVADIPESRRAALRIAKSGLDLVAPAQSTWRWELSKEELAERTRAAAEAYDIAVADADDDDFEPLVARASFFYTIYDYQRAYDDLTTVVEAQPTSDLLLTRAEALISLGKLDEAVADIQAAYDLQPDNATAYWQAQILARAGRGEEAIMLLDSLPVGEDDLDSFVDSRAMVLGLIGDIDTGLTLLEERLLERDDNSTLLNADCWYRGLHKVALDSAVAQCTRAVERAQHPAAVLDSRAMVHYRMGRFDEALADLDAALKLAPGLSNSLYLKGIIMLEQGDRDGRRNVDAALLQMPELRRYYALFGIEPKL